MKKTLELIFLGRPESKDNHRPAVPVKKNGTMICLPRLSQIYYEYEQKIKEQALEQLYIKGIKDPISTPIIIEKLNIYFDRKPTTNDFFNYGKSLFDALNQVVYNDDSQIIGFKGEGRKLYDKENPRFELTLSWDE